MGASSSKKKEEEKIPLIPKKTNKEKNNNKYFPDILRIHSDLNTIELKTEINNEINLDIKYFLDKFKPDNDYSCHLCNRKNENKMYYCNQCNLNNKYICENCLYDENKHSKEHLNSCIIFYKSINICSTHNKEANIICKDCEKNVCSKCFDEFYKWHEKLDNENSDIKKAKNEIIKKNEQLNKFIEFYYMLYKVIEGHPDGKIFKDNIINISKWIKKEKKINNINQELDNDLIEKYLEDKNIKSKNINRTNYLCFDLNCDCIPEILGINSSSGKILLKCNDNHKKELDIIEYMEILEQKKDNNPKNNNEKSDNKVDYDITILKLKIEDIIYNIKVNNLILSIQENYPKNYYYIQNIINIAEYIEEENNKLNDLEDIDNEKKKEQKEKEALNSLKEKYKIFLENHYKQKDLKLKLKGPKDKSKYKWLKDEGFKLISQIRFTDLIEINFANNEIEDITPINNMFMPHLEIINLSYNKIKNITPLTKLYSKKLSFILLENNLIEDLGPFLDSNFPSLKILKVINNNSAFEKNNFKSVLKKFEDIIICQLKWNDFSKRYKLDNNKINEENFKKSNKLDLSSRGCGDIILNDLFPLINSHIRIIYLILDNNRLNDVSLLDKMPLYYLENLDLSLNLITSIKFLKKLFIVSRNLKILYLQDNKINDITPFLNDERKIAIKLEILTLKNNCLNLTEKETLDVFNKLFKIEGLTLDYQKDDLNL